MSKTQKPKTSHGARNDNRSNGKAFKTAPGRKRNKRTHLSTTQLVLLGKGMYQKRRVLRDES